MIALAVQIAPEECERIVQVGPVQLNRYIMFPRLYAFLIPVDLEVKPRPDKGKKLRRTTLGTRWT